nr:retrovirus-related Pol polyprotein from transposon TNT 1-94 [Tanacetum cinerariifolium]
MARHDEQKERIKPWHIDSAVSNHMTGEEDLFVEMEQSKGNVTFGDESKAPVKGKGLDHNDHPNQVCEGCLFGKHARSSFLKVATSRAKEPLQLIHIDLCGPITPSSYGKNHYFILFIDDFSRKTWVYFLKEKSQAFEAFKTFKAMVEKEKGLKIKSMRSDRGGEFLSKEFNKFFDCAVYLLNRCPSKSLDSKTPQEAWNGLKPTVSHLRVFGSIAYVHVPSQRRLKLDDRSEKHVFVGYDKQSKEETDESSEEARQSQSPTPTQDSPLSSSNGEPKTRSLQELYEVTDEIPLLCLYADYAPLVFENAMKRKKCRQVIDGEIRPIERKDTWKLTTLPKGQKAIGVKWVYKANKKRQRRSGEVQGKNCGKMWKIHQMAKHGFHNLRPDAHHSMKPWKNLDPSRYSSLLSLIIISSFLNQHPGYRGNIVVDDVNGGRLIFYDFGMMGIISPNIKEGLLEVIYGVYEKDPNKVETDNTLKNVLWHKEKKDELIKCNDLLIKCTLSISRDLCSSRDKVLLPSLIEVAKFGWAKVSSPGGNVVQTLKGTYREKFEFKAPRSGMYQFYFHNPYSTLETVSFYIHVGHIPNEHDLAKDADLLMD